MANPVSKEERNRIVGMLRDGISQNATAKAAGRSPSLVNKIAREEDIENIPALKKANEARKEYAEEERLALSDEMFEKLRTMVTATSDAGEFRHLAVSYGILTEKRRLETGEATSRSEAVDPSRREKMKASLDEIAAQRRKRVAGDS